MNFNLGLVGHPDIISKIKKIIEDHFDKINIYPIDIVDESQIKKGIKSVEKLFKKCDGILYSAKDIYYIFNNKITHHLPNTYIERCFSDVYKALFDGVYHQEVDIKKVSIDSLSYDEIIEAYRELGIHSKKECSIKTIRSNYTISGFIEKAIRDHINNYNYDKSFCITHFTSIRDYLKKKGIKVALIEPNTREIIKKVNKLISKKTPTHNNNSSSVVVTITISNLKENLIINNSQHSVILEYNRIMEEVFWFAERIDGAYSINGHKSYTIFCSSKDLEDETNNLLNLDILNSIARYDIVYGSIGIGYGKNFKEAIKHSIIGNIRSTNEKKSSAYIVYHQGKIVGPLLSTNDRASRRERIFDIKLEQISSKTSININTLYKIHSALKTSNSYTSNEVAEILGVTRRSANRILGRLEYHGFIENISLKSNGGRGRPSRIIRFLF